MAFIYKSWCVLTVVLHVLRSGVLVTEGIGVGMSDEDEGEGNGWKLFSRLVTLLISTSSFSVTWS